MVGGFGFVCYYYAISTLKLGDALALFSLHPILTVLLAFTVLGEPLSTTHVVAVVASAVGAVWIAQPSWLFHTGENNDTTGPHAMGVAAALVGTSCGAATFCLIRLAGKSGAHTLQLLFSWVVFGIVGVWSWVSGREPSFSKRTTHQTSGGGVRPGNPSTVSWEFVCWGPWRTSCSTMPAGWLRREWPRLPAPVKSSGAMRCNESSFTKCPIRGPWREPS